MRKAIVRGCDHFRVIGQTQIVVGTEIDDRMRFAVVVKRGPRFGRAEELRLVQLDGPLPDMVPSREGRGRFQRILAVADKFFWGVFSPLKPPFFFWGGVPGFISIIGTCGVSHASWFLVRIAKEGDTAIALIIIRLSRPIRYGTGRTTSTNKKSRFNLARPNFAQERGF